MFLSRVELSPEAASREDFWREVAQPQGAHHALWRLMSRSPEQTRDFLFRAEERAGNPSFLVLSKERPQADDGLWRVESRAFAPTFTVGQRLGFKLTASPVIRKSHKVEGMRPNKPKKQKVKVTKHDVVMNRLRELSEQENQAVPRANLIRDAGLDWLQAQGERAGFRIPSVELEEFSDDGLLSSDHTAAALRVDGYRQHRLQRKGERSLRYSTLDFEGQLEVTDPVKFLARVQLGFGPEKAFGCGLMLLRRA